MRLEQTFMPGQQQSAFFDVRECINTAILQARVMEERHMVIVREI